MLKKLPVFFIILLFSAKINAQVNKADSIANVLDRYSSKNILSTLFIHFDKNVYTNNDQVWFTGYLLKTATDLSNYHTLYLSLLSDADSSIVVQKKFLIEKGFVLGNLRLPDSILNGNFKFIAHTNIKLNGKPDVEFVQSIAIKSNKVNPLTANLSVFKTKDEKTGNGSVLLKVLSGDNRFIPNAEVSYVIGKQHQILLSGKSKTSIIGEVMIDFPADKITAENNIISVTVKKDKYIRYAKIELPFNQSVQYKVNFYPEGGYMVTGIPGKVGWEITDIEGSAISAKGVLFANDKVLDTIVTKSSGMGWFYLSPEKNVKYIVKLIKDKTLIGNFELPQSLNSGAIVKFPAAFGNDELKFFIESNVKTQAHVVIHNYEHLYSLAKINLSPTKPSKITIKLDSVPKGINVLTLLDSLYRPIAERIFFAHYDKIEKLDIDGAKEQYLTRDSVKLNLKLNPTDKSRNKGLVSIAVVQSNRVNLANKKNIVDYNYLENNLGLLPVNVSGIKLNDLNYLEDVLLIKGWRKYKWPNEKDIEIMAKNDVSSLEYSGTISKGKNVIKSPMQLTTIAGSNINQVFTDSLGYFKLPYNSLITESAQKIWLSYGGKNPALYNVKISDPFDEIKTFLKQFKFENSFNKMDVLASAENISSFDGIKLNEVTIKKSNDNSIGFQNITGVNECGDYVCQYGILNCNNHSFGTLPIKGKTYPSNGRTVIYAGCLQKETSPNFLVLNGIELPKEFYVSDITNKNEPINFATIYWSYQTVIDNKAETPLIFTTGDLTGDFKIIIQGVTENGPVYSEKLISVKK
ncbi:hypothetical protein [Pedobacter sp. Leaf132]|uniref:hypothetical protein n=1 Tax=Pedobacter sp. Leaf132 TaxID=2876557 RepID=UPI001E3B99D8|nr:hypothetical protein [Pedobacter sp. Leaf132]